MAQAVLQVHQTAEAEESVQVLLAVEGAEHAGEIVGRGDLGAKAAADWIAKKSPRAGTSRTGATGLEPATSGVTGRRSNQLNYAPRAA